MLELFCGKKRLREHQIFEKRDDFENRPSCKGYSLCKIVSLGQKLKLKKTCEKRFFNDVRVVLCKKPLEKTPNIREMRRFWKSAIIQRLQPLENVQYASKIKILKHTWRTTLERHKGCSLAKWWGLFATGRQNDEKISRKIGNFMHWV